MCSIPTGKHVRAQGLFSVRVATSYSSPPLSSVVADDGRCLLHWRLSIADASSLLSRRCVVLSPSACSAVGYAGLSIGVGRTCSCRIACVCPLHPITTRGSGHQWHIFRLPGPALGYCGCQLGRSGIGLRCIQGCPLCVHHLPVSLACVYTRYDRRTGLASTGSTTLYLVGLIAFVGMACL